MVEKSKAFHWVTIDRDRTPEIPKRLNVSAYPSVLVLGKDEDNVFRFESFQKKERFAERLDEGLRRWTLYRDGKAWDVLDPRPARITDAVEVTTLPAPSEAVPVGIESLGGDLFVAQWGRLFRLDAATGKPKAEFPLAEGVADLATDGKLLYAVEAGWTAGLPIRVIDPETGKEVRQIVTEANRANKAYGAKGIAFHEGRLLVLEGMEGRLREVDPATGAVKATVQTPFRWLSGLASDGKCLVTATREKLLWLDPSTGEVKKELPMNYWVRCVGLHEGAVLLMEQPIFGFGRKHERIQLWPRPGETVIHKLVNF